MSPDSGGCYSSDNIEVNPSDQGGCYDTINSDPYSSSMITFFSYWYRLIMIPRYKSFTHHPLNHPSFDRTLTWYSRLRLVYIVTKTNRIHNRLWVAFKLYVPSLLSTSGFGRVLYYWRRILTTVFYLWYKFSHYGLLFPKNYPLSFDRFTKLDIPSSPLTYNYFQ